MADFQSLIPMLLMNRKKSWKDIMLTVFFLVVYPKLNFNVLKWLAPKKKKKEFCEYELISMIYYTNGSLDMSRPFKFALVNNFVLKFLRENNYKIEIEERDSVTFVTYPGPIPLTSDLTAFLRLESKQQQHETKEQLKFTYTITLRSEKISTIQSFIERLVAEHDEKMKMDTTRYIFKINEIKQKEVYAFKHEFLSTKSFESIFFHKKKQMLNSLDGFLNNEERYKRLGIPYTLGFLFHGLPGSGKTSCIKAIAKYTDRHIVVINPNVINDVNELVQVFLNKSIHFANGHGLPIPIEKRLYVLEEIDASHWAKIIRSRKLPPLVESETLTHNGDDNGIKDVNKTKPKEPECKVTLGDILEVLDGIMEIHGRMIIMTTNHPEVIDEALIRPGRLDFTIEFTTLMRQDIKELYRLWFSTELDAGVYEKMKDNVFSQAQIGKLFSVNDMEIIHKHLIEGTVYE